MVGSLPRNNGSASEEAIWLVADFRKVESFSEAREIRHGLDAGARM
jgi:hypothetical protein